MLFNVPNSLTWLRILLIPLFIGVFYVPADWLTPFQQNVSATVIFVLAAVTDLFDGYLARRLGQTSAFGAFLDPVADKLMVAASLVLLVQLDRLDGILAFVIVGREVAVSALREWMAQVGEARSVAVSFLGKIKTISQMIAIPMLLYHERFLGLDIEAIGTVLIFAAAFLTLWSMFYYLRRAWPRLSSEGRRG